METILKKFRKVPAKTKGMITISEQFAVHCPFCKKKNMAWTYKFDEYIDANGKCAHFAGVNRQKQSFIFENGFDVKTDGNVIFVNNVRMGKFELAELEII